MHNPDLEQKILICLIIKNESPELKEMVFLKVPPECFYKPLHRELYSKVLELYRNNEPYEFIDLLIHYRLDNEMNILLNQMSENVRDSIYILYQSDIDRLINTHTLIKKINDTEVLINKVKGVNDELKALQQLSHGLADITNYEINQKSGLVSIQDAVDTIANNPASNTKIKTNIRFLNEALEGGFKVGSVASFVAQPRMGKTFFSIYLMDSILQANPETQGLFFSLEMPVEQIVERHTALKANRIFNCLDEQQKQEAFVQLMMMNYKLCDVFTSPKSTDLDYICNYARIEHSKKPLSVIVIDYMTKIDVSKRFDRDDLKYKYIASQLANLAIELKCVIINLMHSNRTPEERPENDRCPRLGDEVQSTGAGTSSGYFFGIDRPELHRDDDVWKNEYRNLFVLACRKSRFCPEFTIATQFNAGLFQSAFYHYSPKPLRRNKNPSDYV